jgi:hypothetical protein
MKTKKRDYKREYALYQGKPEQIARRSARNKARRIMEKDGLVHKGDGKDVDHIRKSRHGALNNSRSNLRVLPRSVNRSRK